MNDFSYTNWHSLTDGAILKKIGEFVRYHRLTQNKSQGQLATDAGLSRSTLSLLERGETVTLATLIQVLRVLDQLSVLENFSVSLTPSPLLLAEQEQKLRKRARKKNDHSEDPPSAW